MTVAVKTLLFHDASTAKRIRQRALTEAAINQMLSHDNIVNTYAYDLRNVTDSCLPDGMISAHWKLYIIQVRSTATSVASLRSSLACLADLVWCTRRSSVMVATLLR